VPAAAKLTKGATRHVDLLKCNGNNLDVTIVQRGVQSSSRLVATAAFHDHGGLQYGGSRYETDSRFRNSDSELLRLRLIENNSDQSGAVDYHLVGQPVLVVSQDFIRAAIVGNWQDRASLTDFAQSFSNIRRIAPRLVPHALHKRFNERIANRCVGTLCIVESSSNGLLSFQRHVSIHTVS
jgi:hypothetical protein